MWQKVMIFFAINIPTYYVFINENDVMTHDVDGIL